MCYSLHLRYPNCLCQTDAKYYTFKPAETCVGFHCMLRSGSPMNHGLWIRAWNFFFLMIAAKHERQKAADCMNKFISMLLCCLFFKNQEALGSAARCSFITICLNSALRFFKLEFEHF